MSDLIVQIIGISITAVAAIITGVYVLAASYKRGVNRSLDDQGKASKESWKECEQHSDNEDSKLWAEIRVIMTAIVKHTTDIAELKIEHKNIGEQVHEIKRMVESTNKKIDELFRVMVRQGPQNRQAD